MTCRGSTSYSSSQTSTSGKRRKFSNVLHPGFLFLSHRTFVHRSPEPRDSGLHGVPGQPACSPPRSATPSSSIPQSSCTWHAASRRTRSGADARRPRGGRRNRLRRNARPWRTRAPTATANVRVLHFASGDVPEDARDRPRDRKLFLSLCAPSGGGDEDRFRG